MMRDERSDLDFIVREERKPINEFGEYDDELTKRLRLKTIKRTALDTTYEKAFIQAYNDMNYNISMV
jgi:hypothetical protein